MLDEFQEQKNNSNWFDKDRDLHPEPARAFTGIYPIPVLPALIFILFLQLSTVCWCLKLLHFQCPYSSKWRANQMMHFGSTLFPLLLCWARSVSSTQTGILSLNTLLVFAMAWLRTTSTFLKNRGLPDLSFWSFTPATSPHLCLVLLKLLYFAFKTIMFPHICNVINANPLRDCCSLWIIIIEKALYYQNELLSVLKEISDVVSRCSNQLHSCSWLMHIPVCNRDMAFLWALLSHIKPTAINVRLCSSKQTQSSMTTTRPKSPTALRGHQSNPDG